MAEDSAEFRANLNNLRKENIKCDVVIKIGNATFPAHRHVLVSRFEFFDKMFDAEMKEKNESSVKFDPSIVSPDVFDEILNHIYTSELNLTEKNAIPICVAVDYFRDENLLKKTENFLASNMKVLNVSSCFEMASKIRFHSLVKKCMKVIVENSYNETLRQELISWLSIQNLQMILEEFRKHSKKEEMFALIVEWVQLNIAERDNELLDLLKNIPLNSLSFKFLKEENVIKQVQDSYSLFGRHWTFERNDWHCSSSGITWS